MIKINLLTLTEEQKKKKKKKKTVALPAGPANFLVTMGLVTGGALLVAGGAAGYFMYKVSSLKTQIEANKKTLAQLEKQSEEVVKQEAMKKEMTEMTALIDTLSQKQSMPVIILDDISTMLPDGVWLITVGFMDKDTFRKEVSSSSLPDISEVKDITNYTKVIGIMGYAFTNNDIVAYIANIKKKYPVAYLLETKREEIAKTPVYKFTIIVGG